jgi:dimethylaniline monooxygenase (N-oxide forming)
LQYSLFKGKRVLVIGAGETAMDIMYQAVTYGEAASVTFSVRRGFLSVPTLMGTVPLDTMITNLFESCYQHPWVERAHIRWAVSSFFIKLAFGLGTGTSAGFNQWAGELYPTKRGYHIINKSAKAMPYINAPFKRKGLGRFFKWMDGDTGDKFITTIASAPTAVVGDNKVAFADGTVWEGDLIVYATGYRGDFGLTSAPTPTVHNIIHPSLPNLGWIGFVRPNVGAIPPMAELQVMWWLEQHNRVKIENPTSYLLLGQNPRTKFYAVDYGLYMHKVAQEIGAAPSITDLYMKGGFRCVVAYCLGQAYVVWFRTCGPFYSEEAVTTGRTELWRTVLTLLSRYSYAALTLLSRCSYATFTLLVRYSHATHAIGLLAFTDIALRQRHTRTHTPTARSPIEGWWQTGPSWGSPSSFSSSISRLTC